MHIVYNKVQILHQLFAYSFPEYKAIGEYDRLEYDWKGSQRMTTEKKVTNYDEDQKKGNQLRRRKKFVTWTVATKIVGQNMV